METYNQNDFKAEGLDMVFVQDNQSMSVKGVLRGLHYQKEFPQGKLVRAVRGSVFDVAVDLRKSSPTFGKWEGFYLTGENRRMLYIPKGFAHGFLALEEGTLFSYLCGDRYDPESDGGLRWNDSHVAVDWPLDKVEQVIVSEKDAALPVWEDLCVEF